MYVYMCININIFMYVRMWYLHQIVRFFCRCTHKKIEMKAKCVEMCCRVYHCVELFCSVLQCGAVRCAIYLFIYTYIYVYKYIYI